MIKFLNTQNGNSPSSFHLIGFSLGAQVAGYAGRRLQAVKLGRITGKRTWLTRYTVIFLPFCNHNVICVTTSYMFTLSGTIYVTAYFSFKGLDPAGPYYYKEHMDVRLDASDAAFVDVIMVNIFTRASNRICSNFEIWWFLEHRISDTHGL